MSGIGVGVNVAVVGSSGRKGNVDGGGNQYVVSATPRLINVGRVQVTSDAAATQLPDIPCIGVAIRSKLANLPVWIGGVDTDTPAVGVGLPLLEEECCFLRVFNSNEIKLIAERDFDEVYVIVYGNGETADVTPGNPPPPDLTAPTRSTLFPLNGATSVVRSSTLSSIFSEAIDPATVNSTTFSISPLVASTISIDSADPTKLLLDPTADLAASTVYTITQTSGITDLAGNAYAGSAAWSFTTAAPAAPADTTPPTVISSSPTSLQNNVSVSIKPTITFSEAVSVASVTSTTVKIMKTSTSQPVPNVAFSFSADSKTVTLNPAVSLEYSTTYTLSALNGASGVKDVANNALVTLYSISFTTESETLTPSYQVAGDAYVSLYGSFTTKYATVVSLNTAPLYNKKPKKYVLPIGKVGNPTGSYSIFIEEQTAAGAFVTKRIIKTATASTLTTDVDTGITIEDSGNTDVAMGINYRIAITYSAGTSTNYVKIKVKNSNTITGMSLSEFISFFGSWTNSPDKELAGIIYT